MAGELARIRDGECDADLYERGLAWAARVRSAIDVRLGEGLHLLRKADRLAGRCFRLADYVREVLDLGEHAGVNLAKLGGELRERPLPRGPWRRAGCGSAPPRPWPGSRWATRRPSGWSAPRAVEQRERLEKRLWESPALREVKGPGFSREKLRLTVTGVAPDGLIWRRKGFRSPGWRERLAHRNRRRARRSSERPRKAPSP